MEDLVVGLAKSVVEGALTKVQSAIEEDEKLRQRAQSNLAFMTVEFEMMQSFLDVANKENVTNKLVATWVRHVRKVAYDVQDCIELVIHLDDGPTWWRRLLPSCWREPLPLDVAVAEIEQLKARVEDVSKCYTRYNLINDSGSKLVMMQQPASRATAGDMLIEARQATKRQQRFGDLTQLITKRENDLEVISVWGVGGDHGTTSIIRKSYNDPEICRNFSCRSWVKLMRPFSPDKFVRCFMAQYYANSCQEQEGSIGVHVRMKMKATQDDLFDEFMKQLDSKYLIVLENLSNMVDWDAIRTFLPHKKDGSRIIVSTQLPEVASLCVGHSYQLLELKKFSDEHSVCAFFEKGSHGDGHNVPGNKGKDNKLSSEHRLSQKGVTRIHSQGSSNGLSSSDKLNTGNEVPMIARGSELKELRKYTAIVRINSSQVTAVWGMPGVGKAAIVRNLYNDKMLNSDQFIKYGWVDISHPFNLRDFSGSLLLGFHSESLRAKDAYRVTMGIKDPIQECRMFLSKYPCFVVLNNIQSTEDWDLIEDSLVSRPSKSVIVVLTNEARIAAHCARSREDILNVKGLEADAAFSLFKEEVQRESKSELLPLTDDHLGLRELILRCGGLPIVISAIARSLATEMTEIKWKGIIASMNAGFMKELESKPQFHDLRGLFGWMHSYIGNCLDILKPCILYLSIFPPEQNIRRRRLVRRWISEGYSKESSTRSLEEHGEELFSLLVGMSIIQQPPQAVTSASSDTRMVKCQVNRFLYEYIISRQKEENLVFQLGKGRSIATQCTWHHLTIWKQWNRDQIVFESINLSRLRSLTVFGDWKPFFVSKTMKLLRVLDLENASGVKDQDLEQMVKLLRRLKFLSLRGCTEICNLPSSLGGLRQLQSLDIRHTSIVTLPAKITKLKKLQYIRAGTTVQAEKPSTPFLPGMRGCRRLVGVKVPRGLGKMKALHTLGVINVSASQGVVKQLQKLTQLHKLGVSGINRRNSRKLFSAISGHDHLESLSVRLKKGNKRCLDDISLPWEKLESLKMYGLGNKLPLSRPLPQDELQSRTRLPEDELPAPRPSRLPQEVPAVPRPCLPEDELPAPKPRLSHDKLAVPRPTHLPEDKLPVSRPSRLAQEGPAVPRPSLPEDELTEPKPRLSHDKLALPIPSRLPEGKLPVPRPSRLAQEGPAVPRPSLPKDELTAPKPRLSHDKLAVSSPRLALAEPRTRLPEDELPVQRPHLSQAVATAMPSLLQAVRSFSVSSPRLLRDEVPVPRPPLPQVKLPLLPQVGSNQVNKLTKLVLEMDMLTQDDMKFLAELPHLCILRLRVMQPRLLFLADMSGLELSTFTKLKILEIACSSSSHVTFGSKTMKTLEVLKLDFSSESPSYLLSGLDHLPELKEVLLKGTKDETLKTALQEKLAKHPNKPVVRLEEQPCTS